MCFLGILAALLGIFFVGRWLLFRAIAVMIMWYSRNV